MRHELGTAPISANIHRDGIIGKRRALCTIGSPAHPVSLLPPLIAAYNVPRDGIRRGFFVSGLLKKLELNYIVGAVRILNATSAKAIQEPENRLACCSWNSNLREVSRLDISDLPKLNYVSNARKHSTFLFPLCVNEFLSRPGYATYSESLTGGEHGKSADIWVAALSDEGRRA
jgi:hypothetical protein